MHVHKLPARQCRRTVRRPCARSIHVSGAFRVVTISSVPMAINAPRGFARCEDASQIRLGRVKNNNISLKWWAYSLRRKSDIQEPEPSTHTPNMCPVPRPARLSQANAACAQTQHAAAPCRVLIKQICVKWSWTGLYVVVSIVQPVADAFTRTRSQR